MGMIVVRIDEEMEARLADILAHEKTDKSELIRRLIVDRWTSLQAGKLTVAERMSREPHLFDGPPDLSERANRKRSIAERLLKEDRELQEQKRAAKKQASVFERDLIEMREETGSRSE